MDPTRTLGAATALAWESRLARFGFHDPNLIYQWPAIVGRDWGARTRPVRIVWPHPRKPTKTGDSNLGRGIPQRRSGVLHLLTDPGFAPEIVFAHQEIMERINGYLGAGTIIRLAVRSDPLFSTHPHSNPDRQPARVAASKPEPCSLQAPLDTALEALASAIQSARSDT